MERNELIVKEGGYLYLAAYGCPTVKVPVTDAHQARKAWESYRDGYGIGGSDLKRGCGDIRTNKNKTIARVSYNGRIWNMDGECILDIDGGMPLSEGFRYKGAF